MLIAVCHRWMVKEKDRIFQREYESTPLNYQNIVRSWLCIFPLAYPLLSSICSVAVSFFLFLFLLLLSIIVTLAEHLNATLNHFCRFGFSLSFVMSICLPLKVHAAVLKSSTLLNAWSPKSCDLTLDHLKLSFGHGKNARRRKINLFVGHDLFSGNTDDYVTIFCS